MYSRSTGRGYLRLRKPNHMLLQRLVLAALVLCPLLSLAAEGEKPITSKIAEA